MGCNRAADAASTAEPAQASPPALHLDMASTNAQERLLDTTFEDFATSLVLSNIYYLFPADTISFSHSIPVLKLQSALDLQATNISSRKPSSRNDDNRKR
jgi:hypothetical protein